MNKQEILNEISKTEEHLANLKKMLEECEGLKKEKQDLIDKYNQISINFYNGDYCNIEHCSLLKFKEQECENLKEKNQYLINTYCHFKNETKKYKKAVHKYKVVLQDKIERLHLSRREFLKEINSISKRIACNNEDFKNALSNFNNAIQVINNEDRYKQGLDKIEKFAKDNCDACKEFTPIRQSDINCRYCNTTQILNIIKNTKN